MGNETKNRVRIIKRIWKLTKRRKPRTTRIYPEIRNEEGFKHTDPHGVTETFASFYKSLYSPLEDAHFDTDFKKRIEDRFQHLIDECTTVTFQEAKL